jgi:hypothetical protein
LREEIVKKESNLIQKKEKLFTNAKDPSQWELASALEDFQALLRDKSKAFSLMLPKET